MLFLLSSSSTLGTLYFPTLDTSISQSFPQSPRLGRILPSHAAAGKNPSQRTRDGGAAAHHGRQHCSAQRSRRYRRREERRGRDSGGWETEDGLVQRPGCCSPTRSLSQPAPSSSTRARPRRDPAHPRRHRRGPSVPHCHLLSDFCLFL